MAFSSKGSRSRRDKEQKKAEEGLKDTFPASDAVAVIQPAPERNILPEIELTDAELNEDQQTGERQAVGHRQA